MSSHYKEPRTSIDALLLSLKKRATMFGARLGALAIVWLRAGAPPAPEDECTLELQSNLTEDWVMARKL